MILGQHIMTGRGALGVCVVVSLALVSGCGTFKDHRNKTEFAFDGIEFKSKVEAIEKEKREHFSVEVRRATQSINGAKEAGRYAATRYCIEQYGTSRIEWISGPDQENQTLKMDDDDLIMEGICKP